MLKKLEEEFQSLPYSTRLGIVVIASIAFISTTFLAVSLGALSWVETKQQAAAQAEVVQPK